MIEAINKYVLMAPFHNKNAGFSKWTYAKKDGREFFVKEFLNPVYPVDDSISPELRKNAIQSCNEYEARKKKLYSEINRVSDGNAVRIEEFFRCDNHYYASSERIVGPKLSPKDLQKYSFDNRLLLCRNVAHSVMCVHRSGIVHADIKLTNIMFKRTRTGNLIGKLIDFDSSFFENDPPKHGEDLGGDQVYMSPEACLFICEEPVKLSCKIDVFALGILFHQYLTGELPGFDHDEYAYAFDSVLDGNKLIVSERIPAGLRTIIEKMLEEDPEDRPAMWEVYAALGGGEAEEPAVDEHAAETTSRPVRDDITPEKDPAPSAAPERPEKKKRKNPEDYFFVVKD